VMVGVRGDAIFEVNQGLCDTARMGCGLVFQH
jgi:hypothetical protein